MEKKISCSRTDPIRPIYFQPHSKFGCQRTKEKDWMDFDIIFYQVQKRWHRWSDSCRRLERSEFDSL